MRAGGFTIQQALTPDAASIIKQALTLARRRGHAQVTPLHVANTMLSASTGLLRTACLQSNSHPLQCRALELCFNVALNRLPASSSNPIMSPHSQHPSISNALVAAFKRAQAHQRRGSIENQQQPLLAVKIELEQLIISILDDPSVSRVMREAGFSSTLVKSNVEQTVSLELCAQNPPQGNHKSKESNPQNNGSAKIGILRPSYQARNEDVMSVIENLSNKKKRGLVIVGECLAGIECVVERVKEKIDSRDVPEELKDLKFISLPLFPFGHLSRGEVEEKLGELKSQVKGCLEKGVILYLGDLKWITEYRARSSTAQGIRSYYCPVEHLVVELGRLVFGIGQSKGKFWLMGIASFQTFMRCRSGQPSLASVWGLQPLTVPAGSLSLTLLPDSDVQSESGNKKKPTNGSSWLMLESGDDKELNCSTDCSAKFESESQNSRHNHSTTSSSNLPSWLRYEKNTPKYNDQECEELCQKWNSNCTSLHKQPESPHDERTLIFSSISPSSSTSCFSYDHQNSNPNQAWPVSQTKQFSHDHQFWGFPALNKPSEQSLRVYIPDHKQGFLSNPNSMPNSASSSDMEMDYIQKFKEFNVENLKTLCNALESKVPWQKDVIQDIAGTVLQCRSGMLRRKEKLRCDGETKEETWFFFQGIDAQAKEKIARVLAKVVFGSHSDFVSIALSNFSLTRADSSEDLRNKRSRDEQSSSYIERFAEAVSTNSHRVFFIEDIEQADYCSQIGIKRAIEKGKIRNSQGQEISLSDAIIILSCESFSCRSRACSPPIKHKPDRLDEEKGLRSEDTNRCVSLDLNMSFEDEGAVERSIDDIGLLESVDRCIVFKIQEL